MLPDDIGLHVGPLGSLLELAETNKTPWTDQVTCNGHVHDRLLSVVTVLEAMLLLLLLLLLLFV